MRHDDAHEIMILVHVHTDGSGLRGNEKGIWDSIHVVEVIPEGNKAVYKLTTTIMLSLKTKGNNLDLSGSVQKQVRLLILCCLFQLLLLQQGNWKGLGRSLTSSSPCPRDDCHPAGYC